MLFGARVVYDSASWPRYAWWQVSELARDSEEKALSKKGERFPAEYKATQTAEIICKITKIILHLE
jgi:hypothetical protein